MKRIEPFLVILLSFLLSNATAETYNIVSYGAKGNGGTINTRFIQQAIDECNRNGGGTVLIPSGIFLSGALFLRSHVNLHLQHGAVLKGSSDLQDYKTDSILYGLICATDLEDVALTGEGQINGNSSSFMFPDKLHTFVDYDRKFTSQGNRFMESDGIGDGPIAHGPRPDMMIIIKHSSRVRIKGLYLTDSPNWTIRISDANR
jgi:polygalacturonase